ncbi:MAG: acylphosphatase [Candidatus Aenigmatarchaeota archaeon]
MIQRVRIMISGDVQAVGFRHFVYRNALELKLNGWVRNVGNKVEAVFEGNKTAIDKMLDICKKGPRGSIVKCVNVSDEKPEGLKGFEII